MPQQKMQTLKEIIATFLFLTINNYHNQMHVNYTIDEHVYSIILSTLLLIYANKLSEEEYDLIGGLFENAHKIIGAICVYTFFTLVFIGHVELVAIFLFTPYIAAINKF